MWNALPEVARENQPAFFMVIIQGVESFIFNSKVVYANVAIISIAYVSLHKEMAI